MYKVLYIDDEQDYLLETLRSWNELSRQETDTSYPLMQFAGLSFRDNNNENQEEDPNIEMHYVDTGIDVGQWPHLSHEDRDELQAEMLTRFLEKITEIQPNAILLDIKLGHRSTLNGSILLHRIRKYYPCIAIVMATRKRYDSSVNYGWLEYYPLSEGLLDLDFEPHKVEASYERVCKKCSHAIDYRGISIQEYTENEIDPRLPDISWAFIYELVNSPLFDNQVENYPVIFLHGSFGSGRRLFALWSNALLQRRRENVPPFPSVLTEINCSCLDKGRDSKAYLKRIFEPSRGGILLLTEVDRLPYDMQGAFKTVIEEWKKNACIIATATDSKRIGLERLPEGIREIKSFEDWLTLKGKSKNVANNVSALLPSNLIKDFKARLKEDSIKYRIVDCNKFNYAPSMLNFEEEKSKLQNEIEENNQNNSILIVNNIAYLREKHDNIKQAFREWIEDINGQACVMINRIYSDKVSFLSEVFPNGYTKIEDQDQELNINPGNVFYFSRDFQTGTDFVDFITKRYTETVWIFDCKAFFNTPLNKKINYLKNELIPDSNEHELLLLENVDGVPDSYLQIFKETIRKCKKENLIVATVTNSGDIGLKNLPNNNDIKEIKIPSLQKRFEGESFLESNNIADLLDSAYPTDTDVIDRLPNNVEDIQITPLCLEINNYYRSRLGDIVANPTNADQIREARGLLTLLENNPRNTARAEFFFQNLCQSVVKRLNPLFYLSDSNFELGLSVGAEILLAIQIHDWPEFIFNQSRGIYDIEYILKYSVGKAINRQMNVQDRNLEVEISDILISGFAEVAENIIHVDNNTYPLTNEETRELGFEILTRTYAIQYQTYQDDPEQWLASQYARACEEDDRIQQPLPPYVAKYLIRDLGIDYEIIKKMNILNELTRIVRSAREVLNYELG